MGNNYECEKFENLENIVEEGIERTGNFLKKAFQDMKESAKAQHEVDKANFAAVKAESKARWEEAKVSPKAMQEKIQKERVQQVADANDRIAAANARIDAAKKR